MIHELDNNITFKNNILSDNILSETHSLNEILLNERIEAIDKISSDVINVNELFTDLALIVNRQGTNLDNIEYNINNATINIEKGKNVIVKIDKKDKKRGSCLCNTIYLCAIIDSIILIIFIIKIIN